MGLSFKIAAGCRQCSHSQVRVLQESRPHFTVSESKFPQPGRPSLRVYILQEQGSSLPTTRMAMAEAFDANVKVKGKVKFTLRLAVYRQTVCLGVKPLETHDQRSVFFSDPASTGDIYIPALKYCQWETTGKWIPMLVIKQSDLKLGQKTWWKFYATNLANKRGPWTSNHAITKWRVIEFFCIVKKKLIQKGLSNVNPLPKFWKLIVPTAGAICDVISEHSRLKPYGNPWRICHFIQIFSVS
jgi:hypothetical protein